MWLLWVISVPMILYYPGLHGERLIEMSCFDGILYNEHGPFKFCRISRIWSAHPSIYGRVLPKPCEVEFRLCLDLCLLFSALKWFVLVFISWIQSMPCKFRSFLNSFFVYEHCIIPEARYLILKLDVMLLTIYIPCYHCRS